MNARQTKKRLKRRIEVLTSDNSLMRRIIEDTPAMQELYDLYNQPVKVIYKQPLQHFRICKGMVYPEQWDKERIIQSAAEKIAHEMIPFIKQHINLENRGMALEIYGGEEYGLTFDFWVDESEAKP